MPVSTLESPTIDREVLEGLRDEFGTPTLVSLAGLFCERAPLVAEQFVQRGYRSGVNQLEQIVFGGVGSMPARGAIVRHAANDLTQPATERFQHPQLIQPSECMDENILHQLFGLVTIAQQTVGERHARTLITFVQGTLSRCVA